MAANFGKLRNVELSAVYYFETQINANWTGVTTTLGFPNLDKPPDLPVVSIRVLNVNSDFLEIGSRTMEDVYNIIIDIFGKSEPQRMDLAQFIQDKIIQDFVYYTHSRTSGQTDTQITRVAAGRVKFTQFLQNTKVEFGEDVDHFDRFRQLISFNCRVALT